SLEFHCCLDLLQLRIDKHADPNPGDVQSFDGRRELAFVPNEIKSAFRGDLFSLLRDEADFIRLKSEREIDNLGRVAHFEIKFRYDVRAEALEIAVLHMAAIGAHVRGNSMGTSALAKTGDGDRIGCGI